MSSNSHRNLAASDHRRYRLGLEHFSQHILPRRLEQELNWEGLDVPSLQDLRWTLASHGNKESLQADLLAYIEFILFHKTKEIERLESAIVQQEALVQAQGSNIDALHNLVHFRARKFEATGLVEDLHTTIETAEDALSSTPALHPDKLSQGADLSRLQAYESKMIKPPPISPVENTGEMDTLTNMVRDRDIMDAFFGGDSSPLLRRLEMELSKQNTSKAERLQLVDTYGLVQMMFFGKHLTSGQSSLSIEKDLIMAFELVYSEFKAMQVQPRRMYLAMLAMPLYHHSFTLDGNDVKKMEKVIEILQEIIEFPDSVSDSPAGIITSHPFITALTTVSGEKVGYNLALFIHSIGNFNPSRLYYVGALGALMQRRYVTLQDPADIQKAVELLREQWRDSIDKDGICLDFGVLLVKCCISLFRAHGDDSLLEEATNLTDEILGHPLSPLLRQQLLALKCDCYKLQWSNSEDLDLLESAITLAESLRGEMSYDRGDGPSILAMLMQLYLDRSSFVYGPDDLNKALCLAAEALDMAESLSATIENNNVDILISQSRSLSELSVCFMSLFRFHRDKTFIEEAIRLTTRAIELSERLGNHDPNKLYHPWKLADLYFKLFHRTGDGEQLTRSIEWCRQAIEDASDKPGLQQRLKYSLANYLATRFASDQGKYGNDMVESMALGRKLFSKLACSCLFIYIYKCTGNKDTLDEAIELAKLSLPEEREHSSKVLLFGSKCGQEPTEWVYGEYTLAGAILERMHADDATWSDDAQVALDCLLRCSRTTSQDSVVTIMTAVYLSDPVFTSSGKLDMADLALATKKAIHTLSRYSSRALKREDIQDQLARCAGLPAAAAASAIAIGHSAVEALKLLEVGRGILTTYLLDTRTEILGLDEADDNLVRLLKKKLAHLELVNELRDIDEMNSTTGSKWQVDKAYTLNTEVEKILEQLHSQGKASLLGLPSAAEMQAVGHKGSKGAVVVINAHFRCDAILIHDDKIEAIYLPQLNINAARVAVECLEVTKKHSLPPKDQKWIWTFVLAWLWSAAVEPILDHLGYTTTPCENEEWPRVWWIPTGELSQLPFHAAGIHDLDGPSSALDRVVSSYSSSVKALIYAQRIALGRMRSLDNRSGLSRKIPQMVVASMRRTPRQRELVHVETEVREVRSIVSSSANIKELCHPDKHEVLKELQSCDIFHFAGHGASYTNNPDSSCLLLEDYESNPLTVKDILSLKLHKHAPFLAYLSACSTGANNTDRLLDEAIHLVTAFQLAGFQHVIGSLWAVSDYSSSEVAKHVYARLKGRFEPGRDVALALHSAVRQLRKTSSQIGHRSTYSADPGIEQASANDASPIDRDCISHQDVESLLAKLSGSRSPVFAEEDWGTARDPRPGSVRPKVAQKSSLPNPAVWAPYFHTGY